jgi:hypothetical protein
VVPVFSGRQVDGQGCGRMTKTIYREEVSPPSQEDCPSVEDERGEVGLRCTMRVSAVLRVPQLLAELGDGCQHLDPCMLHFTHPRQVAQLLRHGEHTRPRRTAQPDLQAVFMGDLAMLNPDVLQAQIGRFEG